MADDFESWFKAEGARQLESKAPPPADDGFQSWIKSESERQIPWLTVPQQNGVFKPRNESEIDKLPEGETYEVPQGLLRKTYRQPTKETPTARSLVPAVKEYYRQVIKGEAPPTDDVPNSAWEEVRAPRYRVRGPKRFLEDGKTPVHPRFAWMDDPEAHPASTPSGDYAAHDVAAEERANRVRALGAGGNGSLAGNANVSESAVGRVAQGGEQGFASGASLPWYLFYMTDAERKALDTQGPAYQQASQQERGDASWGERTATGVARTAGSMLAAMPAGAGAGAAGARAGAVAIGAIQSLGEVGPGYEEKRAAGLSPEEARNAQLAQSGIEVAVTSILSGLGAPGTEGALSGAAAKKAGEEIAKHGWKGYVARELAKRGIEEAPEELIIKGGKDWVANQYPELANEEAFQKEYATKGSAALSYIDTAVQAIIAGSTLNAPATAGSARAGVNYNSVQSLVSPEGASAFAASNPEAARSILDRAMAAPEGQTISRTDAAKLTGMGRGAWAEYSDRRQLVDSLSKALSSQAQPDATQAPVQATPAPVAEAAPEAVAEPAAEPQTSGIATSHPAPPIAQATPASQLADSLGGIGAAISSGHAESLWRQAQNKDPHLKKGGTAEQAIFMAANRGLLGDRADFDQLLEKLRAGESLEPAARRQNAIDALNALAASKQAQAKPAADTAPIATAPTEPIPVAPPAEQQPAAAPEQPQVDQHAENRARYNAGSGFEMGDVVEPEARHAAAVDFYNERGAKYHFFQSPQGAAAPSYTAPDGTIYINAAREGDALYNAMADEWAHSSGADKRLADLPPSILEKHAKEYLAMAPESYRQKLQADPVRLNREAAALFMAKVMSDPKYRTRIRNGNPTLMQKIVDELRRMFGSMESKAVQRVLDELSVKPGAKQADSAKAEPSEQAKAPDSVPPPVDAKSPPSGTTGTKNAKTDELRAKIGMGERPEVEPETFKQWDEEAARRMEADPQLAGRLAREVAATPRPLTTVEVNVLNRYKRDLENRRLAGENVYDEQATAIEASERGGTQQSHAFSARKAELAADFTLEGIVSQHLRSLNEKPTEAQMAKYAEMADRIKALEGELEAEKAAKVQAEIDRQISEARNARKNTEADRIDELASEHIAERDAEGQKAFRMFLDDSFEQAKQEDADYRSALAEARRRTKLHSGNVDRIEDGGRDHTKIPGFAETAREIANDPAVGPYLGMSPRNEGGVDTADYGQELWDALRNPRPPVTRVSDQVVDGAKARYDEWNAERIKARGGDHLGDREFAESFNPDEFEAPPKATRKSPPKKGTKLEQLQKKAYDALARFRATSTTKAAEPPGGEAGPGLMFEAVEGANIDAAGVVAAYKELGVRSLPELTARINKDGGLSADQMQAIQDEWGAAAKAKKPEADEIGQIARDITRSVVESGIDDREAVIDAVHKELTGMGLEVTRSQTMEAMSGYGDFRQLSKDEISVKVRGIKGEIQQLLKLEDMQAGRAPKKTGVERREPTDAERQLIKQVNEAKKRGGYQVTDPAQQLKSALEAAKTAARNRIDDLEKAIASREKIVSGATKLKPDAELTKLREKRDALNAEYRKIFPAKSTGLSDSAKLKMAERMMDRLVAEMQADLAAGRIGAKPKSQPLHSPALDAKRKELADLKRRREEMREKSPEYQKQEAAKALAERGEGIDRRITKLQADIDAGRLGPEEKTAPPTSPEIEAKQRQLDALKQVREQARAASPEYQAAQAAKQTERYKKSLERQKAFWEKRLNEAAAGKLPEKRKPTPVDDAILEKKYQIELVKRAARAELEAAERNARGKVGKALGFGGDLLDLSRAIQTGFEMSAVLRQGAAYTLGFPKQALRALNDSVRAAFSRRADFAIHDNLMKRANHADYVRGGLETTAEDGPLSHREELLRSRIASWLAKQEGAAWAPPRWAAEGILGGERAFRSFLNTMRADLFDYMKAAVESSRPGTWSEADAKTIANAANVFSGRAPLKGAMGLSRIFFAPRWVWSRVVLAKDAASAATGLGWKGDKAGRLAVGKVYVRAALGMAAYQAIKHVLYSLGADDEEHKPAYELDPRSSDFGKTKLGETRIDSGTGMNQIITLLSRLATGETKTSSGKVIPIRGEDVPYGADDSRDIIHRFIDSKLAPLPSAVLDFIVGEGVTGDKATPGSILGERVMPMTWRDIWNAEKELNVPQGTVAAIEAFFGAGVSTYGSRNEYRDSDEEGRKSQFEKYLRTMEYDSPDPAFKEFLSADQMKRVENRRTEVLGSLLLAATQPDPVREKGEAWEKFYERVDEHQKKVDKARATLRELNVPQGEAEYAITREAKSRGYGTKRFDGTKPTSFGKRARQLNELLQNSQN